MQNYSNYSIVFPYKNTFFLSSIIADDVAWVMGNNEMVTACEGEVEIVSASVYSSSSFN
jgi:hypothetical protein